MSPPDPKPAEPRHFSIRLPHWGWFLVLTVVLAVAGVGVSIWLPYYGEQQVIQKIKSWGGSVETETVAPTWLRQLFGEARLKEFKVFERVNDCNLEYGRISDADVICLGQLANLDSLILGNTSVTDAALFHLSGMKGLKHLCIWDTAVTGAGLAHLSSLPNLELLNLGNTAVTDADLAPLCRMAKLKSLIIDDTPVTDEGLMHLRGCTHLESLQVNGTSITKAGFEELHKALPDCKIQD